MENGDLDRCKVGNWPLHLNSPPTDRRGARVAKEKLFSKEVSKSFGKTRSLVALQVTLTSGFVPLALTINVVLCFNNYRCTSF